MVWIFIVLFFKADMILFFNVSSLYFYFYDEIKRKKQIEQSI